jgi:hypothetical protein
MPKNENLNLAGRALLLRRKDREEDKKKNREEKEALFRFSTPSFFTNVAAPP